MQGLFKPVLAIALLGGSGGVLAQNPYGEVTVPFEIKQAPDAPVYYTVGFTGVPDADNQGHTSNAGFVITGDGVVAYDALGTPALGYRLLQAIRERTDEPVKKVIAGHYHADHIYGLQAFREHTDAEIVAQANAMQYVNGEGAQRRLQQRSQALFPWVDEDTYIVEPDTLFEARHRFTIGGQGFEVLNAGPAHSPSDAIMVIEDTGVIFVGDIVFDGRLPFLGDDVDTNIWLEQLEYLSNMEPRPRFIIPGHGQATKDAQDAIAFTRGYIQFLREQMGEAVQDFVPFGQAYEQVDWSRYRDVPTFDAANRSNAYSVYLEMESELF